MNVALNSNGGTIIALPEQQVGNPDHANNGIYESGSACTIFSWGHYFVVKFANISIIDKIKTTFGFSSGELALEYSTDNVNWVALQHTTGGEITFDAVQAQYVKVIGVTSPLPRWIWLAEIEIFEVEIPPLPDVPPNINTGCFYNDAVANIVSVIDKNKENIGIKHVFGSIPPFIPVDLFPVICVTRQTKNADNFLIVPAALRPELNIEIWMQYLEVDGAIIEKVKDDIGYAARIENAVGILAQKIEAVLRLNRTLDGYCQETQLQATDFRFRQQPARPQTLVAGVTINLLVRSKMISI